MSRQRSLRSGLPGARWLFRGWRDSLREVRDIVRETLQGDHGGLLPPVWLRDVGPTDFEATGGEFLNLFIQLGGLRPSDSVLDVGCGPGRMALPLTRYLSHEGRYIGMDIVGRAVNWCRRNISRSYPNFRFLHADIVNERYNPTGTIHAHQYRFPFEDRSFDFVFLTSVFTHMYPRDTRHYLREIARLLQPSGRLFCTFFLLNSVQRAFRSQGRNEIDFRYDHGAYQTRDEAIAESAVAVSEEAVKAMMRDAGLAIREPISYGRWTGRDNALSFQDVLVAELSNAGSVALLGSARSGRPGMRLGVIILNWNAAADTRRCVLSVKDWSFPNGSAPPAIWVVDNGSVEPGLEELRGEHPEVRFLMSPVNRGFAGGNNLGIAAAMAAEIDAVLLLNNDATLRGESVASMLAIFASDPEVGLVGPTLWDGDQLLSIGGRDIARYTRTHVRPSTVPEGPVDVDHVSGTAVLIHTKVFKRVGLLDEDYFFSGELADLCARARRNGLKSVTDTRARATHDLERSAAARETLHAYYVLRNRFLYVRKHCPKQRFGLYALWSLRAARAVMSAVVRCKRRRAWAIALGLVDGLRGRFGGQNDRVLC